MISKEICTIDGVKWFLGEESEKPLNWNDAIAWCESIGQQLPSREVLLMAYLNPETRGNFANNGYWSSSEGSSNYAWGRNFGNGSQDFNNKNTTLPVRAVRAIKLETA